ncbi:nuclear receptor coactivator 4-like isoform X2 [Branchiostoma lanceolatum]|uniref:nuclear receptor coactivator 4-like isoform X1 n=1 Tax=Branchiostoma lanceolatum TaxID=7740 RepID=UPI003456DCC3
MAAHHWELLGELRRKITDLENAISRINAVKRNLQANSAEVKSQVHAAISRQLEALRSREVWLLNQVETLQHAKEDILHGQQTQLSEALGEARHCADHVEGCLRGDQEENCDSACIERVLADNLNKMKELNTEPEETSCVEFSADTSSLRESIHRFGRVDCKNPRAEDLVFSTAGLKAASLPSPFEEYGDQEHHVLYKTVEDARRQQGQEVVHQAPLPDLRKEDWLARGPITTQPQRSSEQDGPSFRPRFGSLGKVNISTAPMCIQDWLLQIRHEDGNGSTAMEEDGDFVMLDGKISCSQSAPSEAQESIEMIGTSDILEPSDWLARDDKTSDKPYTEFPYFEDIKKMKDWILKYEQGVKSSSCFCAPEASDGAVEIENLGQLCCMKGPIHKYFHDIPSAKEAWLMKNAPRDVQSLCRANEVCSSFSDCVCDQNCQQQAPEHVHQYFKLASSKVTDWLLKPKNPSLQKELDESPIFTYFRTVMSDPDYWLAAGTQKAAAEPPKPSPFDDAFSAITAQPCGYWLAHRGESKMNKDECPCHLTSEGFSFKDEGTKYWLHPVEGKEEDSTPTPSPLFACVIGGFKQIQSQPKSTWLARECRPEPSGKPQGKAKGADAVQFVLDGLQQLLIQPKEAWLARPAKEEGGTSAISNEGWLHRGGEERQLANTAVKATEEELGYDPDNAAVQMALGGLEQFMTLGKEAWLAAKPAVKKDEAMTTDTDNATEEELGYNPNNPAVQTVLGGLKQFEALGKEAWLEKGRATPPTETKKASRLTKVDKLMKDVEEKVQDDNDPENEMVKVVLRGFERIHAKRKEEWLDRGDREASKKNKAGPSDTTSNKSPWLLHQKDEGSVQSNSDAVKFVLGGVSQIHNMDNRSWLDRSGEAQQPVVKNTWMWRRDQDLAQWLAKPASK